MLGLEIFVKSGRIDKILLLELDYHSTEEVEAHVSREVSEEQSVGKQAEQLNNGQPQNEAMLVAAPNTNTCGHWWCHHK